MEILSGVILCGIANFVYIYSTPLNNHVYQSNCRLIVPRAKERMHINEHTICTQSILLCTPHLCNQLSLAR